MDKYRSYLIPIAVILGLFIFFKMFGYSGLIFLGGVQVGVIIGMILRPKAK